MGLSASKKISDFLSSSQEFDAACNSVYDDCLVLSQYVFSGVRIYQLSDASLRLHLALSASLPIIKRWAPSPPSRFQVDRTIRTAVGERETLDLPQFKSFARELFTEVIVSNAREKVIRRIPVGIAGIAGLGLVTRSGRGVVGTVMGVYAVGVAAAVYLSLRG